MCAYLKVCSRIRLGLSVTAHSLCLHGARNSFSYNAFQADAAAVVSVEVLVEVPPL